DCRIACVRVRSAVAFVVVEKQFGDRAVRKPADGAHITEVRDRELEGLRGSAIGQGSARHRSPPKEVASARCVGNIPTLRSWRSNASKPAFSAACGPRPRAMVATLLPQCRQLSGSWARKEASNREALANARKGRRRLICCQAGGYGLGRLEIAPPSRSATRPSPLSPQGAGAAPFEVMQDSARPLDASCGAAQLRERA